MHAHRRARNRRNALGSPSDAGVGNDILTRVESKVSEARVKFRVSLTWSVIGLAVLVAAGAGQPRFLEPNAAQGNSAAPPPADGKRTPVIVELFTSEGCSSCPPADALLASLEKTQPVPGAEVIALKEHVDYWNHLGWRDPYSSALFSARQNAYAQTFRNDAVYTPQMIVDGQTEFSGSQESRARQAIARAARTPKAAVHLQWKPDSASGNTPALEIGVEQLVQMTPGDTAEVYLAITESELHSEVTRGENAGRKLDHFDVVRELKRIGQVKPQAATSFAAEPQVKIASAWKRENLLAVVFVQEARSRRVLAAASISFSPQ